MTTERITRGHFGRTSRGLTLGTGQNVFIGTDSGATTSKISAVWEDGRPVSTRLLQRPTGSGKGPDAVVAGWIAAINEYLHTHALGWHQVLGVGLAIPGPFRRYGVLDRSANLPASFAGWDVHTSYRRALEKAAGRVLPLTVGNDGKFGGVAEAQFARGSRRASVLMLAPGSGLGSAFVGPDGLPLDGDTLAGMETAHMPAPLHLLGTPPFPCGCGKNWGCIETCTTLSGLPYLLAEKIVKYPKHPLTRSTAPVREKALALRGLAQKGDRMAMEIFDFQARALGLHVANLAMALDPGIVVIGGGLMDPEATTEKFRERYLRILRQSARPYLWPAQRKQLKVVPAKLGELSQSIGAALVARHRARA